MKAARGITSRAHPLWMAYIVHRISGLVLALFLPLHFWVLAMAAMERAAKNARGRRDCSVVPDCCFVFHEGCMR